MNILGEIAEKTRERIKEEKRQLPLAQLKARIRAQDRTPGNGASGNSADRGGGSFPFRRALEAPGISYICEVKKASPSKGVIAREYESAGAAAISCLTEPYYFRGSDEYLREIAQAAGIPVLRKDFTVDEYMIYQAKALGASAVLLICVILEDGQLREYRELAEELGLDALVEAHDERELERALASGARIVGVNNRDLKTFEVDVDTSVRLRRLVPPEILFVSESGIRTPEDIRRLRENGTDGVLIGETLMRSPDKRAALEELNGGRL